MTKLYITIGVTILASLIGIGSYYIWGPDNAVEEICEDIVQNQTGAPVEFSPVDQGAPAIPSESKQ